MPIIGIGTLKIKEQEEIDQCISQALENGYRHIDTARAYGNEQLIGNALAKCGVPREELFITTKVNFKAYGTELTKAAIQESLEKLRVSYLDLVLLHWPFNDYFAAWRVLEEYYAAGTIKAIGVSNFYPDRMIDLINFSNTVPAVNQIETHLFCQRNDHTPWMKKYGVQHEGYAPLGAGRKLEMFESSEIVAIAKAHGKTPAQVALRFLVQQDIVIIPKTSHAERMKENIDIFDFELTDAEMAILKALDKDEPMIGNPRNPERVETTVNWA
jgi:diketogulonate reductase-like aldo/keto reductase